MVGFKFILTLSHRTFVSAPAICPVPVVNLLQIRENQRDSLPIADWSTIRLRRQFATTRKYPGADGQTVATFISGAAVCRRMRWLLCRCAYVRSLVFAVPVSPYVFPILGLAVGAFRSYVQTCHGTDSFAHAHCDPTGGQENLLDHSEFQDFSQSSSVQTTHF